jgi:hypothetical protein
MLHSPSGTRAKSACPIKYSQHRRRASGPAPVGPRAGSWPAPGRLFPTAPVVPMRRGGPAPTEERCDGYRPVGHHEIERDMPVHALVGRVDPGPDRIRTDGPLQIPRDPLELLEPEPGLALGKAASRGPAPHTPLRATCDERHVRRPDVEEPEKLAHVVRSRAEEVGRQRLLRVLRILVFTPEPQGSLSRVQRFGDPVPRTGPVSARVASSLRAARVGCRSPKCGVTVRGALGVIGDVREVGETVERSVERS